MNYRKIAASCVAICALSLTTGNVAEAARVKKRGFEADLRLAYALPLGKVSGDDGQPLSDLTKGHIPIVANLGFRASPVVFVGGYIGPSFGRISSALKDSCSGNTSCNQYGLRLGLSSIFHLAPKEQADPWLGVSAGYERFSTSWGGGLDRSIALSGWEVAGQGGVGFKVNKQFAVGPFLSVSGGQFTTRSCEGTCDRGSQGIDEPKIHGWLSFGVRGSFTAW